MVKQSTIQNILKIPMPSAQGSLNAPHKERRGNAIKIIAFNKFPTGPNFLFSLC